MAFLEGLANPLVQYLKDKKANKSKEMAAKAAKKQEAQLAKAKAGKESSNSPEDVKKKGKEGKSDKLVEKAAREAVKILNREAATKASSAASTSASEVSGSESSTTPKLDVTKVHGRQRPALIAAHIKMLQRDLGLSPAQAHRQVRRDTADALKAERAAAAEKAAADSKEATSSQSLQTQAIPTAPKASTSQARDRKSLPSLILVKLRVPVRLLHLRLQSSSSRSLTLSDQVQLLQQHSSQSLHQLQSLESQ
jgi:regulator of nonsense transcripts 3